MARPVLTLADGLHREFRRGVGSPESLALLSVRSERQPPLVLAPLHLACHRAAFQLPPRPKAKTVACPPSPRVPSEHLLSRRLAALEQADLPRPGRQRHAARTVHQLAEWPRAQHHPEKLAQRLGERLQIVAQERSLKYWALACSWDARMVGSSSE
eukprot:6571085-Prymnesium_polylepis.3